MNGNTNKKITTQEYYKGCLKYTYDITTGFFTHNLSEDLQLFIIWEGARKNENSIIEDISESFEILSVIDMTWSPDNFNSNIKRFYKFFNNDRISANIKLKVRGGDFTCIVVRDLNYNYRYRQNVSGPIQLVNINALDLKRKAREEVGDNIVHSSGCPEEFFDQAALLFTEEQLLNIISGQWKEQRHHLKQDLVGINGWDNFEQLFKVLKLTTNYLVSRNCEYLPDDFFGNDKDVDVICDNFEDFVAAANVDTGKDKFRNFVRIEGQDVIFDIRHPVDNYMDGNWVKDVISRKVLNNREIYILRDDDHFFTLLYHAILQKPEMKKKYLKQLDKLSKKLKLDFFKITDLSDDKKMANLIQGYLKANDYKYTKPNDLRVHQNHGVLQHMGLDVRASKTSNYIAFYQKYMPVKLKELMPAPIKRFVKRFI